MASGPGGWAHGAMRTAQFKAPPATTAHTPRNERVLTLRVGGFLLPQKKNIASERCAHRINQSVVHGCRCFGADRAAFVRWQSQSAERPDAATRNCLAELPPLRGVCVCEGRGGARRPSAVSPVNHTPLLAS